MDVIFIDNFRSMGGLHQSPWQSLRKSCRIIVKCILPMASFPAELSEWLQPGAIGAGLAIVWAEVRAQSRRIDELREDLRTLGEKLTA
ncbi:MAG: hypothetical protein TH68_00280 [Candidatus Synechococcus spongiarum 142]|uniref:Uncharacterized protein n=1 Tax=Candidatus Synechococcus spongiarum 142 TaxID=1608213 RepID=A0A6N3XAD8_9SYNE|nr:MAG: hypothetical protein TH68_00280 [Candidatus Synechococcus spongiarum 142]